MSRITVADGIGYAVTEHGRGDPLLLIHGFTGSAGSWATVLSRLTADHLVLRVDLLGHGRSDSPPPERHAVERQAADLAQILGQLGAASADVLGYSFGARIALRLALDAPASVRRLVLESPSAGIARAADRAQRRAADQAWVDQLRRGDLDGFVRDWAAQSIFVSQASLPSGSRADIAAERASNRPEGLAASLLGAGQGVMMPLHDRLGEVVARTLVISGALDPRGAARAREVAEGIPGAIGVSIQDSGHTPHLETPQRFGDLVTSFLAASTATPIPTAAT